MAACPLNIAVREESIAVRTEEQRHSITIDITLIHKVQEDILSYLVMVGSIGSGEKVK